MPEPATDLAMVPNRCLRRVEWRRSSEMKLSKTPADRFGLNGFLVPESQQEIECFKDFLKVVEFFEQRAARNSRSDHDWRTTAKFIGEANGLERIAEYLRRGIELAFKEDALEALTAGSNVKSQGFDN